MRLGGQMTAPSFCFVFAVARCSYCVPEYATMHSLSMHYFLNMHWLRVYNRSCCSAAPFAFRRCMSSVILPHTFVTPSAPMFLSAPACMHALAHAAQTQTATRE